MHNQVLNTFATECETSHMEKILSAPATHSAQKCMNTPSGTAVESDFLGYQSIHDLCSIVTSLNIGQKVSCFRDCWGKEMNGEADYVLATDSSSAQVKVK